MVTSAFGHEHARKIVPKNTIGKVASMTMPSAFSMDFHTFARFL
jgi:hypothetical protein